MNCNILLIDGWNKKMKLVGVKIIFVWILLKFNFLYEIMRYLYYTIM